MVADGERADVRVLHIEDDESFAEVASRLLERVAPSLDVTVAAESEAGLERLSEEHFDCVLCDYDLPGRTGIEVLEAVREEWPDLPFVLFTGKGSEEVASEAFSAGATDYFRKPTDPSAYEVLAERITTAVEKYRTERRLERSEERYRRLVETAPVPIVVHQGEEILFANQAAAEFVSLDSPAELVGTDPLQYLSTDDRAVARERVAEILGEGTTAEALEEEYVDAEGDVRRALVAGSAIEHGGERAVQVVIQDVTERREREQELQRYQQLVEAMGDGVYALDAAGRFEMVNERMVELTGYSREELQGRDAADVMTEEGLEAVENAIRSLVRGTRESATVEVQAKRADGEVVPRKLTVTLQPTGPDETFAGTVGVVHDITERLERERELEAKNERLEAFAEIVSHDLRNPLNVVSGHVELARELAAGDASGEELEPQLAAIAEATERMTTLTEDLLALAKEGNTVGEREPVALASLAREVWSTLDTAGATLAVADAGTVEADPTRLEQLLANLLENAVEHAADDVAAADEPAADGGDEELTVTVEGTPSGFAVADDGPGIPADEQSAVFERGYSTEQGTGFGLAIVRTVAEAHGWTVELTESEAGGARFEIHTD